VAICLNGAYSGDPLSGGNGYFDMACKAPPGIVSRGKKKGIDHGWMADVGGHPTISLFADKSSRPAPRSVLVTIDCLPGPAGGRQGPRGAVQNLENRGRPW
jgi:hypothetical protein